MLFAAIFSFLVLPTITTERWLGVLSSIERGKPASVTVRVQPFAGVDTSKGHVGSGGVLIARGEVATPETAETAAAIDASLPHGPVPYIAYLLLVGVLAGLFTHHMRRSTMGRLVRVQLVSLGVIVVSAIVVKAVMLTTSLSVLVIPVALFAMVPTLVLDRIVGLATGTLAALVFSLLVPFDVGIAVMLMVPAGAAGLVIAERPKTLFRSVVIAGGAATLFTAATYPLMLYLTTGRLPIGELRDPVHSAWLASALGPALATVLAIPLVPLYQLAVGEITKRTLDQLDDMEHPMLKQIASKSPGTWQHSLAMANMAQQAASAIGANGRLVRVGAYYHDLGKSLQPKYFIENLEPGETSPHDKLPPEVSCDAIFAHVTEGIVSARRAGLHERIIDFMHMHHGNGVLEYFWGKTKEQGNPKGLSVEHFRYPGVPPQSRETAILSICDAVEAASRTLKKPQLSQIDNLVQRIVYGKLHLGQLDDSGLSMGDLRRLAESLRETIRHANHDRIEYPWQKAQQDASSAGATPEKLTQTGPRLDSLDRPAQPETVAAADKQRDSADPLARTDDAGATPNLKQPHRDSTRSALAQTWKADAALPGQNLSAEIPLKLVGEDDASTVKYPKENIEDVVELRATPPKRDSGDYDEMSLKARTNPGSLAEMANQIDSLPPDSSLNESDPRLRRVTNPVVEAQQRPSQEVVKFASDAKKALDHASKDLAALPKHAPSADSAKSIARSGVAGSRSTPEGSAESIARSGVAGSRSTPEGSAESMDIQIVSQQIIAEAVDPTAPNHPADSAARKKAATLPPFKVPTAHPPIGRRSPTLPPSAGLRPPTSPANLTVPPPSDLRPPAPASVPLPGMTAPPPVANRAPAPNYLDDMITLRPQYEAVPDPRISKDEHGNVRIEPRRTIDEDAVSTRPRMDAADTAPNLDLPLRAPPSSPVIPVPPADAASSWAQGLESRLAKQLDDDFGTDTPVHAPTRAEMQALMNQPPDVTRQQSVEEIEALHRQTRERPSQDLDFTRRAPYPTAEVDESDIEAAIELAPPARRTALGVAKKPPKE